MTFDGGQITTDGGAPLLREVDYRLDLIKRFAKGFIDYRDPDRIEHDLGHLLRQRIFVATISCQRSWANRTRPARIAPAKETRVIPWREKAR
jgi:hypothetical protein